MSFPLIIKILANDVLVTAFKDGYQAGIQDLSNICKQIESGVPSDDMPQAQLVEVAVRKFLTHLKEGDFDIEALFGELFPLVIQHTLNVEADEDIKGILELIEDELNNDEYLEI